MMHFLNPYALWLLALVPPIVMATSWLAWWRQEQLLTGYGERSLISRFSAPLHNRRFLWKALAAVLAMVALIVALARPSHETSKMEYPSGSIDVVAVVDVSRSMAVQDYQGKMPGADYKGGTRLDMARYLILNDIIPALGYNRLGVVSFSGNAFPQAFVGDDLPALKWILRRTLTIGSAPGEGSDLAGALNMASALLDIDQKPGHKHVVVIFSDGGSDSSMPDLVKAATELRKRNVEIIVVGLGSKTPHAIPIDQLSRADKDRFSGQKWYTLGGQVVTSGLDENTLLYLKNTVGGRYVRVNSPSDFHIGSLTSEADVVLKTGEQELFYFPLMVALVLAALAVVAPCESSGDGLSSLWGTLRSIRLRRR